MLQPVPSYPAASKSVNPFDVNESSPAQAPMVMLLECLITILFVSSPS